MNTRDLPTTRIQWTQLAMWIRHLPQFGHRLTWPNQVPRDWRVLLDEQADANRTDFLWARRRWREDQSAFDGMDHGDAQVDRYIRGRSQGEAMRDPLQWSYAAGLNGWWFRIPAQEHNREGNTVSYWLSRPSRHVWGVAVGDLAALARAEF